MDKLPIKGILFDFGGTLDTDGNHWGEVLWDVYQHFDLPVAKADFREAYKTGERTLATQPLIQANFHFADVLRTKFGIQLDYLIAHRLLSLSSGEKEQLAASMTDYADGQTRAILAESAALLSELKKQYKLALVSNFYGNIRTVLGGGRRTQAQPGDIRFGCLCARPAGIAGARRGRLFPERHPAGPPFGLSYHLAQRASVGR